MKKTIRNALVALGWSISVAALTLQAFYGGHSYSPEYLNTYGPALAPLDIVLFFPLSMLLGLILSELDLVVKTYFWSIGLSVVLIYFCITLPEYLGVIAVPMLQQLLSEGAIIFIFRSMVPSSIICLMGSLFGAFLGEKFDLQYVTVNEG